MAVWGWVAPKFDGDQVNTTYWWNIFCNSPSYYVLKDDINLYEHYYEHITNTCRDVKTVIELGPGSSIKEKTFKLLPRLKQLERVIYEDTNVDFLHECANETKKQFKNLDIKIQIGDFTDTLPKGEGRTLLVISGCTIMNFDDLALLFRKFSEYLSSGDYMLVTYDVCTEKEKNESTYTHPAFDECTKCIWKRAARDLPILGMDVSSASAKAIWVPDKRAIRFHTVFDTDISLLLAGKPLSIEKGKLYWNGTSYRRSDDEIKLLAASAGYKMVKKYELSGSTLRLGLFTFQ